MPDLAALTICEYIEYLPQKIEIQFESLKNKNKFIIDCIDTKSKWIIMHESKSNTTDCHCIKLNIEKFLNISNISTFGICGGKRIIKIKTNV